MMFAGYYDISTHKMRKNNRVSKYLTKFSHKSILLIGSFGFQDSADGYFWDIGKHQPMEDAPRKYWIQNGSNSKKLGIRQLNSFQNHFAEDTNFSDFRYTFSGQPLMSTPWTKRKTRGAFQKNE